MTNSSSSLEVQQLENANPQPPEAKKHTRKMRLDRRKCVVCGAPRAGVTLYIFFESGRSKLFAPFCQEHLKTWERFANPIFENPAAVELFAKKHPKKFAEEVKGKSLVFFTRIGYHSMIAQ